MKSLPIIGQNAARSEKPRSYENETQAYSTWGGKLLQHTDVLFGIQHEKVFRPITVQLAPTEGCDSSCDFCSVSGRPVSKRIPWDSVVRILTDFRELGAKSVELTGGGNPLIYRDGARNINDVVELAASLGYEVGIITNTENLAKRLRPELADKIAWIRVSLIKLDEGKTPEDFDFSGFPIEKLACSYIVYDREDGKPGTTVESIEKIARVVELNPGLKFVRIAPNCLNDDALTIKKKWGDLIAKHEKFFIKEINDDYHPFDGHCWVGALRPYVVWNGIYICTSHVLQFRNYHPTWKLCDFDAIKETWAAMNARHAAGLPPYDMDVKGDCDHCYYAQSNRILHFVTTNLPDRNFA